MAWTSDFSVDVGSPTRAIDFNRLMDNDNIDASVALFQEIQTFEDFSTGDIIFRLRDRESRLSSALVRNVKFASEAYNDAKMQLVEVVKRDLEEESAGTYNDEALQLSDVWYAGELRERTPENMTKARAEISTLREAEKLEPPKEHRTLAVVDGDVMPFEATADNRGKIEL